MKPLWIVLGLVALLIVVLLFVGGGYVGSRNQMVAKESINRAFEVSLAEGHSAQRRCLHRLRQRRIVRGIDGPQAAGPTEEMITAVDAHACASSSMQSVKAMASRPAPPYSLGIRTPMSPACLAAPTASSGKR